MDLTQAKSVLRKAKGKAIRVLWFDAHVLDDANWVDADKINFDMKCQVDTVGIYIGLGGDQVWVSQASLRNGEHHSHPFAIPLGCVSEIKLLR